MSTASTTINMTAGSTLVRSGSPRRHVYNVTAGALRLVRLLPDGRRQVAGFALPGDFIGLSESPTHRHSIEAVNDSRLCRFSVDDMRMLRARFPQLERKLLERACHELDAAHESMMALARMNPLERLADFLLKLSAHNTLTGNTSNMVVLPMTRADIADHLGLTVETVSRNLTKLRQQGLIALPDIHQVEILDFAGLEALPSSASERA